EHRAFWGSDNIGYGIAGTASRAYMGPLPAAGKWVLLHVPAKQVGLEGSTVSGMAFDQYYGRATWDYAGKATGLVTNVPSNPGLPIGVPPADTNSVPPVTSTNAIPAATSLPGVSLVDYLTPQLPKVGDNILHVLTPTLLELKLITTKQPDPAQVTEWN